jgi:hypothetical protein
MGIETKLKFVRAPTPRELAALRARGTAKAAKDAQRLADAAAKAVADAEAKAKANAAAEAEAQDAQHPPVLFGQGQRFRTANLVWREWASGATHVAAIATGYEVADRKGFAEIKACVDATLELHRTTGERASRFFVSKDEERIGSGYFDSEVTASDIAFLFAKLAANGFEGHVAYTDPDDALLLDDSILAKLKPIVDDALAFENVDAGGVMSLIEGLEPGDLAAVIDGDGLTSTNEGKLSVINTVVESFRAAYPMPAFGDESLCLPIQHNGSGADEFIRFDAGEQLPPRFAALWHAERDRYQTILASCKPRNFLVYDVLCKTDRPTEVFEMRGEFPFKFAKVAEAVADDGEGGGFVASGHGSFFDDPPTPEVLAFVCCRLSATGRWLCLCPHQMEFVTPEVHALMSGTTIHVG